MSSTTPSTTPQSLLSRLAETRAGSSSPSLGSTNPHQGHSSGSSILNGTSQKERLAAYKAIVNQSKSGSESGGSRRSRTIGSRRGSSRHHRSSSSHSNPAHSSPSHNASNPSGSKRRSQRINMDVKGMLERARTTSHSSSLHELAPEHPSPAPPSDPRLITRESSTRSVSDERSSQGLEARGSQLVALEEKLEQRQVELHKDQLEKEEMASKLKKHEEHLDKRENALISIEVTTAQEAERLRRLAEELRAKEAFLLARTESLEEKQRAQAEATRAMADAEAHSALERKEKELERKRQEDQAREAFLLARTESLEEKQRAQAEAARAMADAEAQSASELLARTKSLEAKEEQRLKREAELERKEKELERKKQEDQLEVIEARMELLARTISLQEKEERIQSLSDSTDATTLVHHEPLMSDPNEIMHIAEVCSAMGESEPSHDDGEISAQAMREEDTIFDQHDDDVKDCKGDGCDEGAGESNDHDTKGAIKEDGSEAPKHDGWYTLVQLRCRPPSLDSTQLENYLSPEEFSDVFKMDKESFKSLPSWKRQKAKRSVGLF